MKLIAIERDGDRYTARSEAGVAWTREVPLDDRSSPFREELIWPAANVVAIACGTTVKFLAAESGAPVKTVFLGHDLFGGFGPADGAELYVLGYTNVIAIDAQLNVRWRSSPIAVDGIVWLERIGDRIRLSCEMDPPGGWRDVELDAHTGRKLR